MDHIKRTKIILDHLDEIVAAVEQAILIEDKTQRRAYLKSVLFYWLGVVYDDAFADRANLEIAYTTAQKIVERLREENKKLIKRISSNR